MLAIIVRRTASNLLRLFAVQLPVRVTWQRTAPELQPIAQTMISLPMKRLAATVTPVHPGTYVLVVCANRVILSFVTPVRPVILPPAV